MRPLFESAVVGTGESNEKVILNPPEGIDLTLDSLKLVASPKDAHHYLACLTNQVITYKNKILDQKQQYQKLQKQFQNLSVEQYRIPENPPSSSKGWSDHEVDMFKLSFSNYGKDFEAAAIIVGSKSASQCRSLYYSKKDKYNFDDLLDEYEAKQEGMDADAIEESDESKVKESQTKDSDIQIVSESSPKSTNAKSPDNFVFKMQIGGITQPVRLQRVPIQLGQAGTQEPVVIDLTDDDDDSRPAIALTISSEKKETVKKVLHVVNIVDDDIQIIGSNNIK
jgi:hypothetical protein